MTIGSLEYSKNRLLLSSSIRFGALFIKQSVFIDSGADDVFIDPKFAQLHSIPLVLLPNPVSCRLADGQISSMISHRTIPLQMIIDDHEETISFFVTPLCHPVILGLSWLRRHNPSIDWHNGSHAFLSDHCASNCLPSQPVTAAAVDLCRPPTSLSSRFLSLFSTYPGSSGLGGNASASHSIDDPYSVYFSEKYENSSFSDNSGFDWNGDTFTTDTELLEEESPPGLSSVALPLPSISLISMTELIDTPSDEYVTSGFVRVLPSDSAPQDWSIASLVSQVYPFQEASATPISDGDIPPEILSKFGPLFSKSLSSKLPPHRPEDCSIDLLPGAKVPPGKVYQLSLDEQKALGDFIKENVNKGFIKPSASPYSSPCFFVKKKDGSLRMCVDYRQLNAATQKNRYPLPLISELIRTLAAGRVFTTLDLRGAYNLLRIKAGDEGKTAFTSLSEAMASSVARW